LREFSLRFPEHDLDTARNGARRILSQRVLGRTTEYRARAVVRGAMTRTHELLAARFDGAAAVRANGGQRRESSVAAREDEQGIARSIRENSDGAISARKLWVVGEPQCNDAIHRRYRPCRERRTRRGSERARAAGEHGDETAAIEDEFSFRCAHRDST
jgi:hypothetical protein